MMKNIRVKNVKELDVFAKKIANGFRGGEVLGLVGDLGAGKTTFVQMLAKHLGVRDAVKSPTFILMQVFTTTGAAKKRGVTQLCHVDVYRLKNKTELDAIGFAEYAGTPGTVTVVEWADRVPEIHKFSGYQEITFDFLKNDGRFLRY